MKRHWRRQIAVALSMAAWMVVGGCGDTSQTIHPASFDDDMTAGEAELEEGEKADDRAGVYLVVDGEVRYRDDEKIVVEPETPFRQIGWMVATEDLEELAYRLRDDDGVWSEWQKLDSYWNEGRLHNGHVVVDEPAVAVEWRGLEKIESLRVDLSREVTARDEIVDRTSNREAVDEEDDVASLTRAVAPSDMVTSREDWGAIDPDKICGSVVAPYRMTLHHTVEPSNDGTDAAERVRQMQSYHINTNGWCDIGYHFVVAQSGEIFQGRSESDRPGAHVGGENSGNVGIAMIGNYDQEDPPQVQIDEVATIVEWVHDEHGVSLDTDAIRGHQDWPDQQTTCPGAYAEEVVDEVIELVSDDDDTGSDDDGDDDSGSDDGGDDDSSDELIDEDDNVETDGCDCGAVSGGGVVPSADWWLVAMVLGIFAVRRRSQETGVQPVA